MNRYGIRRELENYLIPDEIKDTANDIFNSMNDIGVKRGNKRIRLLFYCVFQAYNEKQIWVDPFVIGMEVFKLKKDEIKKSFCDYSPSKTGYRPVSFKTTPAHFVKDYCKKLGLTEETAAMAEATATEIVEAHPELNEMSPRTICAGILKYFCVTNGIVIDDGILEKVTGKALVTINEKYKLIVSLDN